MPTVYDQGGGAAAANPYLPQVKSTLAKGLSGLGDILSRPSMGVEAALSRGPSAGLKAFMHSEDTLQQQADRDAIKKRLGLKETIDKLPPTVRGIADALIDTGLDPTTYIGGLGLLEKGVKTASPHLAAALAKGASKGASASALYDVGTHSGEAVRAVYGRLPAAKAQALINNLEMVRREHLNKLRGLRGPQGGALKIPTNAELEKKALSGVGLTAKEKAAAFGPVHLYFAGQEKTVAGAGSKALRALANPLKTAANVTNIPYFFMPFRHMGNITALAALADPAGTVETVARKIGAAFPSVKAANEALVHEAQRKGLTSFAPERSLPGLSGASLAKIPGVGKPIGKALHGMYSWSQQTLWEYDDLARSVLIKRAIAKGMKPADAAHRVNRALVDYGTRSPAVQSLYNVAPFATFRSGIPGAVARSVLQHPERAQIADRLTGGEFTGGTQEGGSRAYLPPADVGRGVGDPDAYLRSTLGWPYQDILSLLGVGAPLHNIKALTTGGKLSGPRYFTYGEPVLQPNPKKKDFPGILPSQLVRVPGADQFISPFQQRGLLRSLLESNLGVRLP